MRSFVCLRCYDAVSIRLLFRILILTCCVVSSFKTWNSASQNLINSKLVEICYSLSSNSYPIKTDANMITSNSQTSSVKNDVAKKQTQPLITNLDGSRIRIGGQRWIMPGDYVVHEEYGVGRYLGVRMVDLTPARNTRTLEPTMEVQYADGEVSWFQRIVDKELWLYRSADAGEQELSTLIDRKKWKRRRVAVEESSKSMAVNLGKMKAIRDSFHRTPCAPDGERYKAFEKTFMYEPTEDQKICFQTIATDMINNTRPMDRLVCGDVGFGKTEVAVRAIYRAVLSKKQVALLAPTRILALQHLRVLRTRMPDINIQLLRGGGKGDALKVKEMIKNGECEVVVGTHALLQPTVTFTNLGLLVIDEEQRFGVGHKEKLKAVSGGTDVLTLSATPIPRTLQMGLSNLRDLSLMNTAPVGRKEVNVSWVRVGLGFTYL
jgi:transcription-repair coupling factor (superfamily II helicase)